MNTNLIAVPEECFDVVFDDPEVEELKKLILEFDNVEEELQDLLYKYGENVLEKTYAHLMGIKIAS
jgi:hypothetical protein